MSKKQKNSRKFQSPIEDWDDEQEEENEGERETSQPKALKSIVSQRPLKASSSAAAWILLIALCLLTLSTFFK